MEKANKNTGSAKITTQKSIPVRGLTPAIVVCGPTATGKSDLAVLLAKKFDGEIISADSRQVYRGLDLGSGKITKKEMMGIPHYMLDIENPKKIYTVDKFSKSALKSAEEILKKNKIPIICGGTGMYIDALIDGVIYPQVLPDKKLRKELSTYTTETLNEKLISLDPNRAEQLKNDGGGQFNRVRLIRSIEIAEKLGAVPPLVKNPNFDAIFIGLDFDDVTIKDRILLRIRARMKKGMLKEAERLHSEGVSFKRMHEFGLEYGHMASVLEGKITKAEFEELLAKDIWQFVKRQRTWFKKRHEILWFKPSATNFKKIESLVKRFLNVKVLSTEANRKNGKNRSTIN